MNGIELADILNLASLWIGVQNLGINLTQDDKQDIQNDLAVNADRLLAEIHAHLEQQDAKIDAILQRLEEKDENHSQNR